MSDGATRLSTIYQDGYAVPDPRDKRIAELAQMRMAG